eukprot:209423-Amphidinium_carterae.1
MVRFVKAHIVTKSVKGGSASIVLLVLRMSCTSCQCWQRSNKGEETKQITRALLAETPSCESCWHHAAVDSANKQLNEQRLGLFKSSLVGVAFCCRQSEGPGEVAPTPWCAPDNVTFLVAQYVATTMLDSS